MARKKNPTADDDKLLELARDSYDEAAEYWRDYLNTANEWAKFLAGDQWPAALRQARENDVNGARPCLTLDRLGQYVRQVQNDARQNRAGIRVKPADSRADIKTARIYQDIIRNIEYVSRAHLAYDHALQYGSALGLGWFRLIPVVVDEARNTQELRIRRVHNWRAVLSDPDWAEPDGSDMKFCFIIESVPRKRFERENPKVEVQGWEAMFPKWCNKDRVQVVEFQYVCDNKQDYVILEAGEMMLADTYTRLYEDREDRPEVTGERKDVRGKHVAWVRLTAGAVLSRTVFPSKYIPTIPVIGNEFWFDDKRSLDGMVKWGKDGQLAYNYARSSDVEVISLAPKTPWLGAEGQFKGHENKWKMANRANIPYLEYVPVSIDGTPAPPPQRQQPPIASGWQSIAGLASGDIEAALGMYKASIGAPSNERSGKALLARRNESDTSTFHYNDNLGISIAHAGRIVVDTMPHFYDHQRAVRLMGEDMKPGVAYVNPSAGSAYAKLDDGKEIFNPLVGKYDVSVGSGPSYASKREEAATAMVELSRGNPQMGQIIGDLMVRAMDWPNADRIADRLKAMLPPAIQQLEAMADDPEALKAKFIALSQENQQQQQAIEMLRKKLQEFAEKAAGTLGKQGIERSKVEVDAFDAETKRIKALETMLTPEDVQQIVLSTMQALLTTPDISAAPQEQGGIAPMPAAMPGMDGGAPFLSGAQ